jgi:hypothetical protein
MHRFSFLRRSRQNWIGLGQFLLFLQEQQKLDQQSRWNLTFFKNEERKGKREKKGKNKIKTLVLFISQQKNS